MSKPSTADFLTAAEDAYSGAPAETADLSLLIGPRGHRVTSTHPYDGFHADAFKTATGQVIVSFEGTDLGGLETKPTFVGAQLQADKQIYEGQNPLLYADAYRFTTQVEAVAKAEGISSDNVFVAGHSLGGAEAEYVAAQTGLSGETFGAPGIPASDTAPGETSGLTNFVDFGDPVGNYSDNPDRVGKLLFGDDIERFGRPTYVGNPADLAPLREAGQLYGTSDIGTAAAAGLVVGATINHHLIEDYAADLGVTLPGGNSGRGSGSSVSAGEITSALSTVLGIHGQGVSNEIGQLLGLAHGSAHLG